MTAGRRARMIASVALGLLAASAAAQEVPAPTPLSPAEAADAEAAIADPATTVDALPDRQRRMTVEVLVDGRGPHRFVVDTAANRSVVSRELATRLALEQGPVARLHDIAGVGPVQTVIVPSLSVGGRATDEIVAPMLPAGPMGANGIVGIDALAGRRIIMDFVADEMTIQPAGVRRPRDPPGTIVVTARRRFGQLIMTNAEIDGRSVQVIVDTGAESSVGNLALLANLTRGRRAARARPVVLEGVTGRNAMGSMATLDRFQLGGLALRNANIAFADLHTFRQFGLQRQPALLLGMDLLRLFDRVTVDFARRRVSFLLDAGPAKAARPRP